MPRKKVAPPEHVVNTAWLTGDWHCGSKFGLVPEPFWNAHTLDATKWMYECFVHATETMPKVELGMLTGDIIDGKQNRSEGVGLMTTCLGEQVEMACECMKLFKGKATKWVRVSGTPYHEDFHGNLSTLDERFGVCQPRQATEAIVRDIDLGGGRIINVKHQPEGSAALYMGTVMDRELIWATLTEHLHGLPKADIIARGHLHTYQRIEGHGKEIILCPCWQLQTPYALNRRYYRWHPDIGSVLLERDERMPSGFVTIPRLYPLPKLEATHFENL